MMAAERGTLDRRSARAASRSRCFLRASSAAAALLATGMFVGAALPVARAAPPPNREAQLAAREKGQEGLDLLAQGRYAEAYARFEEADALFHAPTLVLHMGHCKRRSGELIAARALYERVVAEPLPPKASAAFRRAQDEAKEALRALEAAIPAIEIVVAGEDPAHVEVRVDGAEWPDAARGGPRELDPGRHVIAARVPGRPEIERVVELAEGARDRVELRFDVPRAPSPTADAPPARGSIVPALVAFGAGGVALGVGAATGLASLTKVDAIQERCDGNRCDPNDREQADDARALATVADASFALAGAALVAGVVLLVVRPGGNDASKSGATVTAVMRPSGAAIAGTLPW